MKNHSAYPQGNRTRAPHPTRVMPSGRRERVAHGVTPHQIDEAVKHLDPNARPGTGRY
jgi:hypothetical protein